MRSGWFEQVQPVRGGGGLAAGGDAEFSEDYPLHVLFRLDVS